MAKQEFGLDFKGSRVRVEEHTVAAQSLFRIVFPDARQPLVITRAQDAEAHHFWTSIPEGRQREAQELGALISAYIQSKV